MSTQRGRRTLVWTMLESRVYHLSANCPALHRANRYHSPKRVPIEEATGPHPYRGRRWLCTLCAKRDGSS